MALVRATVRLAETELARDRLERRTSNQRAGRPRIHIEALGRNDALLRVDDDRGHTGHMRVSPRDSELMLLLANTPRGHSGDELTVLLHEDESGSSTLRAELSAPAGLAATGTGAGPAGPTRP
jgi:hypothetical protein